MYGSEDDLVDYNDPEFITDGTQPHSHTPVQTPQNLDSDSEGEEERVKREEEEAKRDLEEGRKANEDIMTAELDRRAKRRKEFETLSLSDYQKMVTK